MRLTWIVMAMIMLAALPVSAEETPESREGFIEWRMPDGIPWGGFTSTRETIPPKTIEIISTIVQNVSETRLKADLQTMQDFGSRLYRAPGMYNASRWLYELGVEFGLEPIYHNFTVDRGSLGVFNLSNVIWYQRGVNESSERQYYLYAHADSIQNNNNGVVMTNAPGADDDGSGCVALIETARLLRRHHFQDTIVYAFFNAEEIGLIGSKFWAQNMSARGDDVRGGIDYDMIGYSAGTEPYDLNLIYNPQSSVQAVHYMDVNTRYNIGMRIFPTQTPDYIPTDITSMYNQGFTGVFGIEYDFNPYYHTTMDTVDKVNFTLVRQCTQVSCALLSEWARMENLDVGIDKFWVPDLPTEGEEVLIVSQVVNPGIVDIEDLEIEMRINGEPYRTAFVDLPALTRRDIEFNWTAEIGSYNLSVTVDPKDVLDETDEKNNTAFRTVRVNDRPIAVLEAGPAIIRTGESITFDGGGSIDQIGGVQLFHFVMGDLFDTGWTYEKEITRVFREDGVYNATLKVRDHHGIESDPVTRTFTVLNRPPEASPYAEARRTLTLLPVGFHAMAEDAEGEVRLQWDFGEGEERYSNESDPIHTFMRSGFYDVTLDIYDSDNATERFVIPVVVDDRSPSVEINVSQLEGDISTVFNFTANPEDPDGTIIYSMLDFGDGEIVELGVVNEHTYSGPGTYWVKVEVRDDVGNVALDSILIRVIDREPYVNGTVNRTTVRTYDRVGFDASASNDLEGPLDYLWNFDDGTTSTLVDPSHYYTLPGDYSPVLRVMDSSGRTVKVSLPSVKVLNRPPTAAMRVLGNRTEGQTVQFDGSSSSDREGDLTYRWDMGDGSVKEGMLVEHSFAGPGNYTVVLTVTDRHGLSSTASEVVRIVAVPTVPGPETEEEDEDRGSLVPLIATNLVWFLLLALTIAFFLLRNRRSASSDGEG